MKLIILSWTSVLLSILAISFLGLISTPDIEKQIEDFKISIEFEDQSKINLTCEDGCEWSHLSFDCPVELCDTNIDKYGMKNSDSEDDVSFLINVQRENEQVLLSCENGCAWEKLSFYMTASGSTNVIDAYGIGTSGN